MGSRQDNDNHQLENNDGFQNDDEHVNTDEEKKEHGSEASEVNLYAEQRNGTVTPPLSYFPFLSSYYNNNNNKGSGWISPTLSVGDSPVFRCSSSILTTNNLHERKVEERLAQKYRQKILKKEQAKEKKRRSVSFGDQVDMKNSSSYYDLSDDYYFAIPDIDEELEKKKKTSNGKLKKNNSSVSLTYSTASSTYLSPISPGQIVRELKEAFAKESNPPFVSFMFGIINSLIVLPIIMSFGSIIYRDSFFRPYMPVLVKLTLISGAVHQFCFSSCSTLPFAIGQVQDAGLIFLSAMASKIVSYCKDRDHSDEEILATTLIGLSIFTLLLGISLIIIGKLQLASIVKALPTPVVGGYLAFIGFFCGQGGMTMMSGIQVSSVLEWNKFFQGDALIFVLPGILGGFSIYFMARIAKSMFVLPICIIGMLVLFYSILGMVGMDFTEAREEGWINQGETPPVWYETWCYFKFDKVVWGALPGCTVSLLSMIFVVALSSGLDVAAIDQEVPMQLEYNYELCTVGLSNVISGLTGGYTGSYIFSQTIFSLRAGIRSRSMGYFIVLCEFLFFASPVPILAYIPNFFFGSLLLMICIDLMIEWLWDVRHKLTAAEYFVALGTFVSILCVGVETGILCGVGIYLLLLQFGFDLDSSSPSSDEIENESFPLVHFESDNAAIQPSIEYGSLNDASNYDNLDGCKIEDNYNFHFT